MTTSPPALLDRFKNLSSDDKPGVTREAAEGEQEILETATLLPEVVLIRHKTSDRGLSHDAVLERRTHWGTNQVGGKHKLSVFGEILERSKNPLVIQLLVIAGVSAAMADVPSAVVVSLMIVLSVILAYVQEAQSNKAVEKLLAMVKTNCTVLRDGKENVVPLSALVPGDLVVLAAGSIIPADLRLVVAKDFFVSQSALTGESMPIEKNAAPCPREGKGALDLPNACFQGSNVLSGTARGVVVNTGARTYFGSISQKLAGRRVLTSFDRGVEQFTWLMIRFMVVMVTVVFLIIGLTKHDWVEALMFALSVAVGLTPEMLPMIVTVNLSKGALAM